MLYIDPALLIGSPKKNAPYPDGLFMPALDNGLKPTGKFVPLSITDGVPHDVG